MKKATQRVVSIDILRGITVMGMILVNNPGNWGQVYPPLLHATWNGWTMTDLIFPFFLFIVGVSISLAYGNKKYEKIPSKKIIIRGLTIFGLGLLLNFLVMKNLETIRFSGVLQRIGLVFIVSAILFLKCQPRQLFFLTISILIGYWLWVAYLPLPSGPMPSLEKSADNWAVYLDRLIFGYHHLWNNGYEPEGLLSSIGSLSTVFTGILLGKQLKKKHFSFKWVITGTLLVTLGYLWNIIFPFNKFLWTGSFVLLTSGIALIAISIIQVIINHRFFKWLHFFKPMGMNALIMYFGSSLLAIALDKIPIANTTLKGWFYQKQLIPILQDPKVCSLAFAVIFTLLFQTIAYYFYRKRWFIKI